MTTADRVIRWSTALALLGVGAVAAVVSCELIYASSMAMLDSGYVATWLRCRRR
jgi:hypothetical protein